jgi:hypothetical protein
VVRIVRIAFLSLLGLHLSACPTDDDSGGPTNGGDAQSPRGETSDPDDLAAWMEPCAVGSIRISCAHEEPRICSDEAKEAGVLKKCEGTVVTPSCDLEGVLAICVDYWGTTRYLAYDLAAVNTYRGKNDICPVYCEDPSLGVETGGGNSTVGTCNDFLMCLCGDLEPRPGDSTECKDARTVVEGQRAMAGQVASDASCANVFMQQPALASQCVDGPTNQIDAGSMPGADAGGSQDL